MRPILEKLLRRLRMAPAPRQPGARRYLPFALGVRGFFGRLESAGARYAVLRWFEDLPTVEPGEDIDMLVADEHVELAASLLCDQAQPGAIPVDLRSVSGLPGTAWREMAYYPPYLAEQILARAVLHRGLCRIPCLEDHFLSLAYHALYHKGAEAGLPTSVPGILPSAAPEHDYLAVLQTLAQKVAVDVPITMEQLDDLLAAREWRPPFDTLDRLGLQNEWVQARHLAHLAPAPPEERGLAVFVIRERAILEGQQDSLLSLIASRGFDILLTRRLDSAEAAHCARQIRGGNWGPGPHPLSGGGPAIVVAACDLNPWPVRPEVRARQPRLENGRIADVKGTIRTLFNEHRPPEQRCNVLHSSDHDVQAWEYVRIALPQDEKQLRRQIRALHASFSTPVPVTRALGSFGRRAKVELIDFQGRPAVRKTFRPGAIRHLQRELELLRRFGGVLPEIPPLLEAGGNYLVMPYYEDVLWTRRRRRLLPPQLLPLAVARQVVDVLRRLHEAGWALIDCTPDNIIVDATRGLKLIDFEYAHQYEGDPPAFESGFSLAGVPSCFNEDLPVLGRHVFDPYEQKWRAHVGLPLASLLHEPAWKQHARRCIYQCRRFWKLNSGRVIRRLRNLPLKLARMLTALQPQGRAG